MTIWIDVRATDEYAAGHINGAILIPHEEIAAKIGLFNFAHEDDIRVYCRTGRRSGIAKDVLNNLGYVNVINEGGYEELLQRKALGQPIP
ncbi:MAG TPA: rhodanese-like domain-containing protein [Cellvibrionaceae bacterium]|nr:rhodanese-like domain-containing protein [Cellvibrionaceae bacterium]